MIIGSIILENILNLIISIFALSIFIKSEMYFKLSNYKGLKYFSRAFLFITFSYLLMIVDVVYGNFFLLFFLSLFSLYLSYSLVWKNNLHVKEYLLFLLAIIISLFGFLYEIGFFLVHIFLLGLVAINSYSNYKRHKYKKNRSELYFISILLALIGFILNFLKLFLIYFIDNYGVYVKVIEFVSIGLIFYIMYFGKNGKKT